jgi:3-isopropylmalate/(R)-2-methylmalate dehydratase small subunit
MSARVWRFGDSVNTDLITPGRFNLTTDEKRLAEICFIEHRPEFARQVKPGDLVIAGRNFACGSSRESAARALKALGVGAVVAQSFGRIFYRNAVNIGLPVFVSKDAAELLQDGDEATLELARGVIAGPAGEAHLEAAHGVAAAIVAEGGIVAYVNRRRGFGP